MLVGMIGMAFLVPSAITRNAVLISAYQESLDKMGISRKDRAGRALMLALGVLHPLATNFGLQAGLNPIACGLIVTIVIDSVILYPVQTATNLLAYEAGYYNAADVRRFGIAMLALTLAVILGVVVPYWSAVGFSLTAPS
jgi:di/tricarboxylate transporter